MSNKNKIKVFILTLICILCGLIYTNLQVNPTIEITFKSTNYGENLIVFYDNGEESVFDDKHLLSYKISETTEFQTALFELPVEEIGQIRIDFGDGQGITEIESISIKNDLFTGGKATGIEIKKLFSSTNMIDEYELRENLVLEYSENDPFIYSDITGKFAEVIDWGSLIILTFGIVIVSFAFSILIHFIISVFNKITWKKVYGICKNFMDAVIDIFKRSLFVKIFISIAFLFAIVIVQMTPQVEIVFKSSNYGESLVLFYGEEEGEGFNDANIVTYVIEETDEFQKATLKLPITKIGRLRIDLGNSAGTTEIKSISIKNGWFRGTVLKAEDIKKTFSYTNMIDVYDVQENVRLTYNGNDPFIITQNILGFAEKISIQYCVGTVLLLFIVSCFFMKILQFILYIIGKLPTIRTYLCQNKFLQSRKYVILYVFIVTVLISCVYISLPIQGYMYMFLDIGADTYCSQWPGSAYAKYWIQNPTLWDFEFGLGGPVSGIVSRVVDVFCWPCYFFSNENMDIGLLIGSILRYYVLAYYSYLYVVIKGFQKSKAIIGALLITFCGWFVGWGQHYIIGTIYVVFIGVLYYFERWMQKKEYVKLIFSVTYFSIISVYFCYMALLFLACYYITCIVIKIQQEKVKLKNIFIHMMQTAGIMILGLCCAAIMFFPNSESILESPRVSGKMLPTLLLGSIEEYRSIFLRMFSNSILGINGTFVGYNNFYESPFMYMGILLVLLLPIFLCNRNMVKKYWLGILLTLSAFVFINASAPLFNAFSTKAYRWTFVFVPVLVCAGMKAMEVFEENYVKVKKLLIILNIFYNVGLVYYLLWYNKLHGDSIVIIKSVCCSLVVLNIYTLLLIGFNKHKNFYKMLILIVVIDVGVNAYISVHDRSLIKIASKETMGYFDDSNEAISYLEEVDDTFYRVSKKYNAVDLNDSFFQHYNGEKLYSGVLSDAIWDMINLFDLRSKNSNYLYGFDDKQILRNITAGKYRLTKVEAKYYGYDLMCKIGDVYIYKNINSTGFGVLYDEYILRSEVDFENQWELQSLLLNSCILEDVHIDKSVELVNHVESIEDIPMKLCSHGSCDEDGETIVELDSNNQSPIILKLYGSDSLGTVEIMLDSKKIVDYLPYSISEEENIYYIDALNVNSLKINNSTGIVSYYEVYELDGEILSEKMIALQEETMQIENFSDMQIKGSIDCETSKLMFIPIPYESNWSVYINDEKTEVYRANAGFMAVVVPQGYAEIEIKYEPINFYRGCICSFVSVVVVLVVILIDKKQKQRIVV